MRFPIALCLVLAGPAAAQTPPEGLTWMALRDLNGAYDDDMEPENRPPLLWAAPDGMLRPVEINGDGVADWRMDYEAAGQSRWCGTGGCLTRLFVSTPDGLRQVFAAQALDLTFEDGEVVAHAHHIYCGLQSPGDCRVRMRLDGDRLVVVGSATFEPLGNASGA